MWPHEKTYLRLLRDVYVAPSSDSEEVVINTGKVGKLVSYVIMCPKKLARVCETLHYDIKRHHNSKSKRRLVESNFLIFQVNFLCS